MGVFRRLRTATKGFALGTHFLFFREAKGSEKKLKALRGLSSENGFKFRASHPVWGWAGL